MVEQVKYSQIGTEDFKVGTGTFETRLADGRIVTLSEVNVVDLMNQVMSGTNPLDDIITKGPWVDVRAYGASPSATAAVNDAAFVSAISTAKSSGLPIFVPAGTFNLTSLFTGTTLAEEAAGGKGLKGLIGAGTDLTVLKFANSASVAWDNTGGRYQNFSGFTIEGDSTNSPSVGFLLARVDRDAGSGNAPSASEGWYRDIEIRGYFTIAAYYNYGAEVSRMDNMTFENLKTSGTATIILTDTNTQSVTSPNTTIAGTTNTNAFQSSIGHIFNNIQIYDGTAQTSPDAAVIISGTKSVFFNTIVTFDLANSDGTVRYFQINNDTGNGGGVPVGIRIDKPFYHQSTSEVAVYLNTTINGFSHTGGRGANGGIVCASGIDISGVEESGKHNVIEAELFDGSASDVDVLGYTEVYVNTSFSISDFFVGQLFIPDGGATVTISTPANFNGQIRYETGAVRKPTQPWVKAHQTSDATNVTGDGTAYTIPFATEVKDTQGDFETPTYAAKYTGSHQVQGAVRVSNLNAATYTVLQIKIVTSNRTYTLVELNPDNVKSANNAISIPFGATCDMEAGDTLTVTVFVSGGTKSVTVNGATGNPETWIDIYYLG